MVDTFVFLRLDLLEKRLQEIDILLQQAKKHIEEPDIYISLCRSAHVLLVAHFEGLIKDIAKDFLDDLNQHVGFKNSPSSIKRTFCEHFLKKDEKGDFDAKLKNKLIETFDELPTKLKVDPFLFENNKNPSPNIIQTILTKFGQKNFIGFLENSDLDIVFQNNKSDTIDLKNRIKFHLQMGLKFFPYKISNKVYNPTIKTVDKSKKTLWDTFLDDLLKHRHSIVHGHTLENPTDHEEIEMSKNKVEILIYVMIINLCLVTSTQSEMKINMPSHLGLMKV